MERPMTSLCQHKIEIAIAVQVAQAGVCRSFGGLLNIDCARELPRHQGNLSRDKASRDYAEDHSSYVMFNCLHRLFRERCSKPSIILCYWDFQSNYDTAPD